MQGLTALLDNPGDLVAVGVAVMTFATVLTLAAPMLKGDQLDARMKLVANRREELRRASRQQIAARDAGLRHSEAGFYKKVVEQLQLSRLLEDPKVVDNLAQAGFRGPKPLSTFYFFRFVMPFVMALAAAGYVYGLKPAGLPPNFRLIVVAVAVLAGFYAPNIYVSNRVGKRRVSVMQAFPDALDLLLICVESGMSVEAALQKVAGEIGTRSIELAEELSLLTAELSYLPERRQPYEGLAKRNSHTGV